MSCTALRSHITDSRFYRLGYTTDEARSIFCDLRRLQRWLDVEMALAETQGALGIIPPEAVTALKASARIDRIDLTAVERGIQETGHSLIPLLAAWQQATAGNAGQYINFGATTQDIQDTAQVLELKDVFAIIERDGRAIVDELARLARLHAKTVTIGRTHGQPALPTTFGLKVASWLDEILRALQRLDQCRERTLVSQMFGGVGTMAAFGEKAPDILAGASSRLGLSTSPCAWHAARDRVAETVTAMAMLAGGLARIANEICQLARPEIGELEEPFHHGKIGSSTMPHKRNPELCEQVVVLSRLIRANAMLGLDGLVSEHERDYRAVRLEWVSVAESGMFIAGALDLMKKILANLIVHGGRMEENARKTSEQISTEALMFLIGERLGKQNAHRILYDLSMQAHASGEALLDLLHQHPEIRKNFSRSLLGKTMDAASHTGHAALLTGQVVKLAEERLASQPALTTSSRHCPLSGKKGSCYIKKEK